MPKLIVNTLIQFSALIINLIGLFNFLGFNLLRIAFNLIFVPQVIKILSKVKFCCFIHAGALFNLFECLSEFKFKFGFIWVKFV